MSHKLYALIFIGFTVCLSGCRVLYPNEMFRQKDYQFFELAKKQVEEYVIQPGDNLTLEVYSRDGFKLVDVLGGSLTTTSGNSATSSTNNSESSQNKPSYLVDREGFAKLPILGMMYVKGYTQNELEAQIAQKYASLFINPFVVLKVSNRRVFVFKGDMATVVELNNAPTSLIEVLAKSGGFSRNVKTYNIKILRGDMKNPEIRIVNLYTLEGLRTADLTVQANDIIYVEQRKQYLIDALAQVTPLISVLTLLTSLIIIGRSLK